MTELLEDAIAYPHSGDVKLSGLIGCENKLGLEMIQLVDWKLISGQVIIVAILETET